MVEQVDALEVQVRASLEDLRATLDRNRRGLEEAPALDLSGASTCRAERVSHLPAMNTTSIPASDGGAEVGGGGELGADGGGTRLGRASNGETGVREHLGTLAPVALPENQAPVYPETARRLKQEGTVIVLLDVSGWGEVTAVKLQRSSGFRTLDDAAVAAVRTWRFSPARDGEASVRTEVTLPVVFRLRGGG